RKLAQASRVGLPATATLPSSSSREHPLEGRVALGLVEGDELVANNLEARLPHQTRVRLRWEAGEERRCTKPIPGPGLRVARSKRGHEQSARREPAMDAHERGREQLARHVIERVERDYRVERLRPELERGEVRMDELGLGHCGSGAAHLLRRDV